MYENPRVSRPLPLIWGWVFDAAGSRLVSGLLMSWNSCEPATVSPAKLFLRWPSAIGKSGTLSGQAMSRSDVLADDAPPRRGRRHRDGDRLPHLPRHGDYGLPYERRAYRGRVAHGRALERQNHRPLPPARRRHQRERGGEGGDLKRPVHTACYSSKLAPLAPCQPPAKRTFQPRFLLSSVILSSNWAGDCDGVLKSMSNSTTIELPRTRKPVRTLRTWLRR